MPGYKTHITVSFLGSAALCALGVERLGWAPPTAALALLAGAAGGLLPDLDSHSSKPRRLAGFGAGAAAALGTAAFFSGPGPWAFQPLAWPETLAVSLLAFFLFSLGLTALLGKFTRHRGLFHSLAVPFLYAGLLALAAATRGGQAALAAWLVGAFGVFSHLALDAAKSFSLDPLKPGLWKKPVATALLWLAAGGLTLVAFDEAGIGPRDFMDLVRLSFMMP